MNLPNKLTTLRVILIPLVVVFMYLNNPIFKLLSVLVYCLAAFTDFLDGYLARKYNLVTDFGKFMDPLADKALVLIVLLVIIDLQVITIPHYASICFAIILFRELMISAFRLVAVTKGIVIAADLLGKIKTFTQDFAVPALMLAMPQLKDCFSPDLSAIFYYVGIILLGISTVLAVISGVMYIFKNKEVISQK